MAGTRWIRLDVDYFTNPKTLNAGRDGRDLHLASICWVARHLTDGHIPPQAVAAIAFDAGLTRSRDANLAITAVLDAGLWTPNGDGWEIHDFVTMNGSKSDAERERARWRDRQRKYRESRRDTQGSHGETSA